MCRLFEIYGHEKNIKMVTKDLKHLQNVGPQKCLAFSTDGSRFAAGGVVGIYNFYFLFSILIFDNWFMLIAFSSAHYP